MCFSYFEINSVFTELKPIYSLAVLLETEAILGLAQLVRASSRYTKVVGSIPSQGTYRSQPIK